VEWMGGTDGRDFGKGVGELEELAEAVAIP
jgi:hypothetical protein